MGKAYDAKYCKVTCLQYKMSITRRVTTAMSALLGLHRLAAFYAASHLCRTFSIATADKKRLKEIVVGSLLLYLDSVTLVRLLAVLHISCMLGPSCCSDVCWNNFAQNHVAEGKQIGDSETVRLKSTPQPCKDRSAGLPNNSLYTDGLAITS